MHKLKNGWFVPDNEHKITSVIINNKKKNDDNYEYRVRQKILKSITNLDTFIDVGANIGIWSYHFQKHFKKVIAYEPSPRNLECLYKNVDNIMVREVALGNKNTSKYFEDSLSNCGHSHIVEEHKPNAYEINLRRLDDENLNLNECSLIKIDVEGYEWQVILGAKKIIEKFRPFIVFEATLKEGKVGFKDMHNITKFFQNLKYAPLSCKNKNCWIFASTQGLNSPAKEHFGMNSYQENHPSMKNYFNGGCDRD